MPIRRTRTIGGERFLKNRHGNSTGIRLAIQIVKDTRESLKKAVKLKDKLIKEANEEWKNQQIINPVNSLVLDYKKFYQIWRIIYKHLYYHK